MVILCGTNRPGARSREVARAAEVKLKELGEAPLFLDLADLPQEIYSPACYGEKPAAFAPFQQAITEAKGILIVTPEYNGSFPGVLKYFIDMLKFPESLVGVPIAFIGVAAGQFGAVRSVEQLAAIVQYRSAHLFGNRLFISGASALNVSGKDLGMPEVQPRFEALLEKFQKHVSALHG